MSILGSGRSYRALRFIATTHVVLSSIMFALAALVAVGGILLLLVGMLAAVGVAAGDGSPFLGVLAGGSGLWVVVSISLPFALMALGLRAVGELIRLCINIADDTAAIRVQIDGTVEAGTPR